MIIKTIADLDSEILLKNLTVEQKAELCEELFRSMGNKKRRNFMNRNFNHFFFTTDELRDFFDKSGANGNTWITYEIKPDKNELVLAFSPDWINETNPNGIALGFYTGNGFMSSRYDLLSDDISMYYSRCEENSMPLLWRRIIFLPKKGRDYDNVQQDNE